MRVAFQRNLFDSVSFSLMVHLHSPKVLIPPLKLVYFLRKICSACTCAVETFPSNEDAAQTGLDALADSGLPKIAWGDDLVSGKVPRWRNITWVNLFSHGSWAPKFWLESVSRHSQHSGARCTSSMRPCSGSGFSLGTPWVGFRQGLARRDRSLMLRHRKSQETRLCPISQQLNPPDSTEHYATQTRSADFDQCALPDGNKRQHKRRSIFHREYLHENSKREHLVSHLVEGKVCEYVVDGVEGHGRQRDQQVRHGQVQQVQVEVASQFLLKRERQENQDVSEHGQDDLHGECCTENNRQQNITFQDFDLKLKSSSGNQFRHPNVVLLLESTPPC